MSKRFFTILIAAAAAGFLSCNKVNPAPENSQDPTPSGEAVVLTAPQLTASPAEVTIDQAELEVTSLTLSWTDAVPQGKTAEVSYTVYANLASKDLYAKPVTYPAGKGLEYGFTGRELNALAASLDVPEGAQTELQFSVYAKAASSDIETVVSNIVKVKVSTYKEEIVIPDVLYIAGSATQAGWDVSKGLPMPKFGDLYRAEGVQINVTIGDTGFKFYFANDGSSDAFFGPDLSSDTFGKAKLYTEDDGTANLFQPARNGYGNGVYTITFDPKELMMTMERTGDITYDVELGEFVYPQGDCFPWHWSFDGPMEKVGEKVYEIKDVLCYWGDNGDSGFKIFIGEGVYSPYFAQGDDATKDKITMQLVGDSEVPQFYPGLLGYENGYYDITADFATMVLTLTPKDGPEQPGGDYDPATAIYVFGGGFEKYAEWTFDRALALIPQGDGTYVSESEIYLNQWCYFKLEMQDWTEFVRDASADDYWTAAPRTKDPDNDCNFVPGDGISGFSDGYYTVKFDRNTLKVELINNSPIDPETAFYLYGGGFENGVADWSFDDKNALVPTDVAGVYVSPGTIWLNQWCYFKFEKRDWTEYVRDTAADNYWTVTRRTWDPDNDSSFSPGNGFSDWQDGEYKVTLDLNNNTVTLEKP
ncbi:MAG: SusE domain-containing protein [Bacteroidales bacterium]|nr:SusE domain-containing protein [Bacteroidales bacterium]